MHARYNLNNDFDEYCGHRALQAFSLSQFIKHTSQSCDAVIAAGDFNSTPNETAYKIIRCNAVLSDAWLSKVKEYVFYYIMYYILFTWKEIKTLKHAVMCRRHWLLYLKQNSDLLFRS